MEDKRRLAVSSALDGRQDAASLELPLRALMARDGTALAPAAALACVSDVVLDRCVARRFSSRVSLSRDSHVSIVGSRAHFVGLRGPGDRPQAATIRHRTIGRLAQVGF